MVNAPNQKLKQLYLMKILIEQTDEEHPMSVNGMHTRCRRAGIIHLFTIKVNRTESA